jgi:hypothetical protein
MRGGTISELNLTNAAAFNSTEPYVDENALIAANREPTAPPPTAPAVQAPAAPVVQPPASTETRQGADDSTSTTEAQPDADLPPEPREPSRRRRNVEPPPEDEPGDAPPGIS